METELSNTVSAVGNYNEIPTSITSLASVVTMISGLTITKEADKPIWADGLLTYTITVDNQATETYTSPVVSDVINTTLVDFVVDSVTIDGVAATSSEYEYTGGTLTVKLTDIGPSSSKKITFQVKKKE